MAVRLYYVPVVIEEGESLTVAPAHVAGNEVVGIYVPDDWTAASITFQEGGGLVPDDSGDAYGFQVLEDADGTALEVAATAGRRVQLPPGALSGCEKLHLRSGTPDAPVAQTGGDKTLVLICRKYD